MSPRTENSHRHPLESTRPEARNLTADMGEAPSHIGKTKVVDVSADDSVKVSIRFTKIEAIREGDSAFNELQYPIDMNVGEAIKRPDNSAIVHFSIKVATNPKIALFLVEGDAIIKGPAGSIHSLTVPEENSPPPIWKAIYREAMIVVTTFSNLFNIPPPPSI
jgi:hypothetical protein